MAAKKSKTTQTATSGQQTGNGQSDAVTLLKADHRKVEQLFQKFEAADSESEKRDFARQVCTELVVHSMLEEEIFYPACREKGVEDDLLDEAQVEHDTAKVLISDLMAHSPGSEFYDAKARVLSEYIKHHVGEEEKSSDGIFAKARAAQVDMTALGQRLQARKKQLMAQVEAEGFSPPRPRSLEVLTGKRNYQETGSMERYRERDDDRDYGRSRSNYRERDEYGRFTSDDDNGSRGRSYGRSSGGRERDEYGRFTSDDERGRYASRSGGRERDEYGRFTSDDERGRYASRSGGRERDEYGRFTSDDDEGYSQSRSSGRMYGRDDEYDDDRRGQGQGWHGDPRGHAEAARRGGEERGYSRSSRGSDDDDDYRSSRGGGRSHGSGWYGDTEGHAEAGRRGWEDRGSYRSSRREDDDDDRSPRGGRGQGGWFGDSRGHAEAARRGWRNRD